MLKQSKMDKITTKRVLRVTVYTSLTSSNKKIFYNCGMVIKQRNSY